MSIQADIVYGHKFGMALTFDVFIPSNRTGAAVVFFNSGGFVSGKVRFLTMNVNLECSYLNRFPRRDGSGQVRAGRGGRPAGPQEKLAQPCSSGPVSAEAARTDRTAVDSEFVHVLK